MSYQNQIIGWAPRLNTKMDYYTFYADGSVTLHEFSRGWKDKLQSKVVTASSHPTDCGLVVKSTDKPANRGKRS